MADPGCTALLKIELGTLVDRAEGGLVVGEGVRTLLPVEHDVATLVVAIERHRRAGRGAARPEHRPPARLAGPVVAHAGAPAGWPQSGQSIDSRPPSAFFTTQPQPAQSPTRSP